MTAVQLPEVPKAENLGDEHQCTIYGYTAAQLREYATATAEPYLRALIDLLDDTQHKNHDCGDAPEHCPVLRARLLITPSETNSDR